MRLRRNFTSYFPIPILLICLFFVVTAGQLQAVYADAATTPAPQFYLPLIQRSAPTATATPIVPPPAAQLALFLDPSWKTSNAAVAVDANGGQHVAFYYYESTFDPRPTHAVYAYCPSQCDQTAAWQSVNFVQLVREVQLELTPDGKPRLLIVADSTVYTGGSDYYYAACNGDCTQQGAWSLAKIASGRVPGTALQNNDELPQRSFELDAAGRPRFVYYDENQLVQPNHFGLFYLSCDSSCEQAAQWQETLITTVNWTPRFGMERVYHPALAFTPDGKPRLVSAQFFPIGDGDPTLTYFECNDACDNTASWQKVSLALRGGGAEPSADIAVDPAGRPRIAFYQEALLNDQGKRLFYFWCNANCLAAAGWQQVDLGLGSLNGQEPDLELDRQGRPRIAYADWNAGGVGFAWCNEQCDTTAAKWAHQLLEDRAKLHSAWPVAYPPHCDGGLWDGLTPTLALAANGDPQIAYDATYHAHCLYDDNPDDNIPPVSKMHLIMRAARLIAFPQPYTLPPDPVTPPPVTPTPVTPTVTPTPVTPTPARVALHQTLVRFADQQWRTSSASVPLPWAIPAGWAIPGAMPIACLVPSSGSMG
ncbi:MAG: hypothetical protein DYG89_30405 [Caldilinea sp. CFX5]|nr:hypothetical protein [Caldilinea sp. CFX5]